MHAPHRLRTGDRFTVGHYIVAVAVEGEDVRAMASPAPAARPLDYQELWTNQGEIVAPPIDPKQLKAARLHNPVHSDFLDWAADVPNPIPAPGGGYAAPPSGRSNLART